MISKDAYVLFCIDTNGVGEMIYPTKPNGNDIPYIKKDYILDYKEVEKYIKESLDLNKYCKVLIAKVTDVLNIQITSCYEEQK